jgi:hypothetical protein
MVHRAHRGHFTAYAHLQNRGDVTRRHPQVGGGIGQRFIQGTDGIQHAEYRIQPVLMHDADIGGQAAGNPDHRYVKTLRHLRHPHRHLAVDRLAIDTPFAGDH